MGMAHDTEIFGKFILVYSCYLYLNHHVAAETYTEIMWQNCYSMKKKISDQTPSNIFRLTKEMHMVKDLDATKA
jgi:hypothetical protein